MMGKTKSDILVHRGQKKGEWFAVHKYHDAQFHMHPHMCEVVLSSRRPGGERVERQEWAFVGKTPFEAFYRCQKACSP